MLKRWRGLAVASRLGVGSLGCVLACSPNNAAAGSVSASILPGGAASKAATGTASVSSTPVPSEATASAVGEAAARPALALGGAEACPEMPEAALDPALPPHVLQPERTLSEPGRMSQAYSIHGYVARTLRVVRREGTRELAHCISVAWPPGSMNNERMGCSVAAHIHAGWLRAISNTLARVPWSHVLTLRRLVLDNRPKEHGIAAYDRKNPYDARDGGTIWLHEHLFREANHWTRGNYGSYYAYHVDQDDKIIDAMPAQHDSFSPVLLHELGHLVMYHLVNPPEDPKTAPPCAWTCADGECVGHSYRVQELHCISPYCKPFQMPGSTENWAEQYRFYYQSSVTRARLRDLGKSCSELLAEKDSWEGAPHAPPWELGLPDIASFQRSRWDSCGGNTCKPF